MADPDDWNKAQEYEWKHTVAFMEGDFFKEVLKANKTVRDFSLKNLISDVYFKEFFNNQIDQWNSFADWITDKSCLEIGPSVAGIVCSWWWTKKKIVIEPLLDKIASYQKNKFGYSLYDNTVNFALPAETIIPELVGKIDGSIVCRNCIDHSTEWFFIISNIASYAKSGCYLLLASDLFHTGGVDEGHYNITKDLEGFRNLLKNLGFEIEYEFKDYNRDTLNYGCVARKK